MSVKDYSDAVMYDVDEHDGDAEDIELIYRGIELEVEEEAIDDDEDDEVFFI